MKKKATKINIQATDNSLAAYEVRLCTHCDDKGLARRNLMDRDLRIWGSLAMLPMIALCFYLWDVAMEAAPAYQQRYAIAYSLIQVATLLIGLIVFRAWGERAIAAFGRARNGSVACLLALTMAPFAADAAAPEDGIWWNPNAPGRGWVIVTQNDVMAVSTYTYSAAGPAVWYLSAGTFNDTTRRFSSALNETRAGQCIGCPFRDAQSAGSAGPLTIDFTTNERATLMQNGETVQIEKFHFGYPDRDDRLFGEWAYSSHIAFGIGDAEFLVFDRVFIGTNAKRFIQFRRRFSTSGLGLGSFEPALNEYLILLDSSTSNYKLYRFKMDANRYLDGRYWLYAKTGQPTGSGSFATGVRVREPNDVGAVAAKRADDDSQRVAFELDMVQTMQHDDAPFDAAIAETVEQMTVALERMKRLEAGQE